MTEETPLWTLLDRLGLDFRTPRRVLIDRHGSRASLWAADMQECHLPSKPLVPGLSGFHFQFSTRSDAVDDLTTAPDWLTASCRSHSRPTLADRLSDRRADRNHAETLQGLAALLGRGTDSPSSNACTRHWRFGRALVTARTFPPRLNTRFGPNSRHAADPGSETETSVTLNPGWLPDLTAAQRGWLADFDPLGTPDPWPSRPGFPPPLWHRWPDKLGPMPAPAYGVSRDGGGFVVISGQGFVKAIPRGWLTSVRRDELTPAKGPGRTMLAVELMRSGQPDLPRSRLDLADRPPGHGVLMAEAHALADALSLPLEESSFPDD